MQQGACREQGCRRLLEALPPRRQTEVASSEQGQASPPRESDSTGTAAGGVYAPGSAGRAGHPGTPAAGGQGEHGCREGVSACPTEQPLTERPSIGTLVQAQRKGTAA